ncbi:hypothetical protein QF022_004025 [Vogesella perlucida]|nr:hypothetical protein [Vogesella perlucida]
MIDVTEGTKDILRGYGEADPAVLEALLEVKDWKRIAQQELERRATEIIKLLDVPTLEAIASGEMDMRAVCQRALDENKQGLP